MRASLFLTALLLAAAAPAVRAANATVMLYRHSTLDRVNSRASRNVAVSFLGGASCACLSDGAAAFA